MNPGADCLSDPLQTLQHHGRSFWWASRLLSPGRRLAAARLYAFCRNLDDIADEQSPEQAKCRLTELRRQLADGTSDEPLVRTFLELEEREGIPRLPALHLVDALISDCETVRIRTTGELVRYCYGVAGTVGRMMCPILGVTDPHAARFAADLGIAMQLTNMARDVLEDAGLGRRYLPLEGLEPEAILAGDLDARSKAWQALLELLELAEEYYASGFAGLYFIPARTRGAIGVAGRVYRAIGDEIRSAGEDSYWQRRAVVKPVSRLMVTTRTLAAMATRRHSRPQHDAHLHHDLAHFFARVSEPVGCRAGQD